MNCFWLVFMRTRLHLQIWNWLEWNFEICYTFIISVCRRVEDISLLKVCQIYRYWCHCPKPHYLLMLCWKPKWETWGSTFGWYKRILFNTNCVATWRGMVQIIMHWVLLCMVLFRQWSSVLNVDRHSMLNNYHLILTPVVLMPGN